MRGMRVVVRTPDGRARAYRDATAVIDADRTVHVHRRGHRVAAYPLGAATSVDLRVDDDEPRPRPDMPAPRPDQ